jgi:hypothetical protein
MFLSRPNEDAWLFVLRGAARVSSIIVFLVLFLFYTDGSLNISNIGLREWVELFFIPVGLLLGFAAGWHDELAGGIIALGSNAAFYLINGLLLSGTVGQGWAFLVFTIP